MIIVDNTYIIIDANNCMKELFMVNYCNANKLLGNF